MFDCLDVKMQEPILEIQDVVKDLGGLRAVNHCTHWHQWRRQNN